MRTLDSIIQDFGSSKEGGITHRRPFLNVRNNSCDMKWSDRGYYA
ncbi:MAG: hypothetical protein WB492_10225 [Christiangramia sp.]